MDLKDLKYYQNYHKHTSLSHRYNKDSPLTYNNYFKYYNDNYSSKGLPQIYSTVEHGWQSTYFHIYDDLEKFNNKNSKDNPNYKPIKFIFGTEGYWVKDRFEKDASNCHIILLAKNENGRKKLNRAIYESFKTGYYYKNRMDLDILLSLPKSDIFVTSACLAFWNSYTKEGIDYTEIDKIVLQLYNHFDDFYLEVQDNQTPIQKEINKHILKLHYQYGIPIIAGTDSHVITNSQLEDRDDLLKSNKISYPEEEGWYMDCPSVEEFIRRFQEQGILSDDEVYEAINNTNKILDFEDIVLDRSLKVPVAKKYKHLSLEERNDIFENILREKWKKQYNDINEDKFDQYIKEIKHDIKEVEECHMADYFIDNYEIMKLGQEKYGGILTPSGRGSGVSMYLNKLLGFTKVDKVNSPVLMYSERFLTKERVLDSKTPPDIDHNVADREPFIQAQKDIICEEGTFDLIALGTLKYKSAFKMYARAYDLDPQIANDVTKQITKYENALKYAEEDEKEYIDIFDYVDEEKYGNLIEGCQEYMGIVDNLKSHPCFTKDNLVMTENGLKNINEIKIGEKVLTIDNNFHKVVKTMNRISDDIYKVKFYGSPIVEVTGNHPFYVARRKAKRDKYFNGKDRRELTTPIWKEVKDLENGDMIAFAINQNSILPNLSFVDSKNNDFWWCIGRYLGDGWRSHTIRKSGKRKGDKIKDVIICCNKNNNETEDIIKHLSWCNYRISNENTINKIYIKCKGLYDWLNIFGDYADNKNVPIEVINLPTEQLKSFIEGYISADGNITKNNTINFKTVSKKLAVGISSCINKVYLRPCSIREGLPNRIEKIEGRTVNCKQQYIGCFHIDDRPQDRTFYRDGYIWCPYYSKEKINKECEVFNFEVEKNHTYNVNNIIVHNCGCLCYDGDAIEDVGVIMVRSESTGRECFVALLESGTIDTFGYLKQDYLIVDSIGLTYDIYKEIGMKPLTVNELLDKIYNDEKVWNIYKNGYTMCINQCEQERSTKKVGRYRPSNISELTQFVAGIRPSFKTMYKIFESRQHFDYGIKAFDNLIQDEYCDSSFILYQEHLMKVLGFAGFPMSETYTIIKAISKKKQYVIKGAKEKFIPNFAQAILHTGETNDLKTAEEMSHKVWQIIEDSAAYGFNSAHAYCMAIDSVTLAWQKAYYPLEFYKVALQRYTNKENKDKVSLLKKEMLRMGIKLNPIKFGDDNRQFSIDKEHHSINQTMASIKDMQKIVPDILYEIGLNYQNNGIFFIFKDMLKSKINKKSFDILIKLNYFRDFGDINYVLNQLKIYKEMLSIIDKLIECKQLKKDYCKEIGLPIDKVKLCCKTETPKMFKDIDNEKLAQLFKNNYIEIENKISKKYTYQQTTNLDIIKYQVQLLGYSDIIDNSIPEDIYLVEQQETNNYGTPFLSLYHPYDGESLQSIKVDKKWFNEYPCDVGDTLRCSFKEKLKKRKDENGKWYDTGEIEHVLNIYSII